MAEITIKCFCSNVVTAELIGEGTIECPTCKRKWIRYYCPHEETYFIDTVGDNINEG